MELYIHIPFCKKKCNYCDFASYVGMENHSEEYIKLLLKEAATRKKLVMEPITTLYIGGGTPSLLPPGNLKKLIEELKNILPIDRNAEFTAEANPGTLTESWLNAAAECGVNRLSIGMQSSNPSSLNFLGRIHSFDDVGKTVETAERAGFKNINIDLIFGFPGHTMEEWKQTLLDALSLAPKHISAYGLIPEKNTVLGEKINNGILNLPEPEEERSMYYFAKELLEERGMKRYEVSNFSFPGFECRHNIGYWKQVTYIGLGLSASSMHSLNHNKKGLSYIRETNPSDYRRYSAFVTEKNCINNDITYISGRDACFETVMLALRTDEGIDEKVFSEMHGISLMDYCGEKLLEFQKKGLICHTADKWYLTDSGMDIQNMLLVELLD